MRTRPFSTEADLQAMRRLLVTGRQARSATYYIHTGDLTWWFYYFNPGRDPRGFTTLWESDDIPGGLAAWALYSPGWYALDVFLHPSLRGSPAGEDIWRAAEERCAAQGKQDGSKKLRTIWIAEHDDWTVSLLERRGFARGGDYMEVMVCSLAGLPDAPSLPEGYQARAPKDDSEAELRALVQYAAFESSLPRDAYIARYAQFMRGPGYAAGLDSMIIAPDGRAAAFSIAWPDEVNKIGLLEPVGVHPDFQRRGLGRAVVSESLRRLRACGMESAMVCGLSDLPAARALYASLGMQPVLRLWTYEKLDGSTAEE